MKRVAINGFGRIGRTVLRALLSDPTAKNKVSVVAINLGPSKPSNLDILFKYDSTMGVFPGTVSCEKDQLIIDGSPIALLNEPAPEKLPWQKLQVDCVVESSGAFTDGQQAKRHLDAGARQVIITAPATNEDLALVLGVNDQAYDQNKHAVISLGSCTTNCFAPLVKVLHEAFGITSGLMTTVHAYTNDQVLLDVEHKDPRRARAAALNMVPTKTGASKLIAKLFPELAGCISAVAIRVPTPVVSLLDFSFTAQKALSVEAINRALAAASNEVLRGIMQYETQPLVSSDFKGSTASCIIDSQLTQVASNMGKVFAWYDNEYGYSCRVRDFLLHN